MIAAAVGTPAGPAQPQAVFWLGNLAQAQRSREYIDNLRFGRRARPAGERAMALRNASLALTNDARRCAEHVRDLGALLHVNAPRLSYAERDDFDYDVVMRPAGAA